MPDSSDQPSMMTEDELVALVGHRFPGGTYRVQHWENWLLTDCTGRGAMPDDLVHPIVLFHAPILGAGTSIGELFRLGRASGAPGSVGLMGYDWEYFQPLREEVDYTVTGGIVAAERHQSSPDAAPDDHVAFSIELRLNDELIARVTNRWRFRRGTHSTGRAHAGPLPLRSRSDGPSDRPSVGPPVGPSDRPLNGPPSLPGWTMERVDPARMKTMAAILRDPYPAHWDSAANERIGLGGRVINQGPLNLGYVANMLMAWAGDAAIRRLTVTFGRPVLDGDHVVAGGCVNEIVDGVAHCDVWLTRGEEPVVTGTAHVTAPILG